MMNQKRPGRNDLCHCGSGKKYKNCCLELDEILGTDGDLFERCNRLSLTCKLKLEQEFGTQIKKIRHDLVRHFTQFAVNQELPEQNESIFSDWLWFDLLDSDENSFAFNYLNTRTDYLPQPIQECMGTFMLSYLSVYEVIASEDNYLIVKNIFTEKENQVLLKAPFEGDLKTQPLLLLGRLLHFKEASVFSGMVLVLTDEGSEKDFIIKHMRYLQLINQDNVIINTLKFNPEILYGVFDHALHKNYLPLSDFRVYTIKQEEIPEIEEKIALASFVYDYDAGSVKWYKRQDHEHYAKIGLTEDSLLVCGDLIQDIEEMNSFICDNLGKEDFKLIHSRFRQQRPEDDTIPLWFEILKDRESERWLHAVHAELDGKTPLEVMETKDGKQQLSEMLDAFKEKTNEKETHDLINHMRLRVM